MNLKTNEKDRKSRGYLFIIIIILALFNALLIYNLINKGNKLEVTEEKLESTETERIELQKELESTQLELDEYIGQNASLDSIIQSRDNELAARASKIKTMLSQSNLSKEQLQKAKAEIAELKKLIASYEAEIERLSKENEYLRDENYAIKKEMEVAKEITQKLEASNRQLSEKVSIASRMKTTDLSAKAVRIGRNEKEREVSKLSAADRIVIRFALDKNEVAQKGKKTIYMKLLSPSKNTIHNEAGGSGSFAYQGEESLYTSKMDVDFQNQNEKVEFVWDKTQGMIPGEYEVLLFCEDHIIGQSKITLK